MQFRGSSIRKSRRVRIKVQEVMKMKEGIGVGSHWLKMYFELIDIICVGNFFNEHYMNHCLKSIVNIPVA